MSSQVLVITRRGRRRSYHRPESTDSGLRSSCDIVDEDRNKKLIPLDHAQNWYDPCGVCFPDED